MNLPFQIYSASAGTGKTYRLTRAFIELLLKSEVPLFFRRILAITFTNKAAEEMKVRVLESLRDFASDRGSSNSMFTDIKARIGLRDEDLRYKSRRILRTVLHNYSYLDIVTIDKFNHRLIQAFSTDLNLPPLFEVELDPDNLLDAAIFNLIERSVRDEQLRSVLVDFVSTSVEEEKKWNITGVLRRFGNRIFRDWDRGEAEALRQAEGMELKALRVQLSRMRDRCKKERLNLVAECRALIDRAGYPETDYYRNYLSYLDQIGEKRPPKDPHTPTKDSEYPEGIKIFKKASPGNVSELPFRLGERYLPIRELYYRELFYQYAIRALYPTLLILSLYREVRLLYTQRQVIHISEFNKAISETVKHQPAPFIYERLGQRYQYYFVDEFQDTSELQWENLIPLIDHSLNEAGTTAEGAGLFLVGDVKQSIYRWRGGNVLQFVRLIAEQGGGEHRTFDYAPVVQELDTNYRSLPVLVSFVNEFFRYSIEESGQEFLAQLFHPGLNQTAHRSGEGYVQVNTIGPVESTGEKPALYALGMKEALEGLLNRHYRLGDVGILVRSNTEMEELSLELRKLGIPVRSVRGHRLDEYPISVFLIQMLRFALEPTDFLAAMESIFLLLQDREDPHSELLKARPNPRDYLYKHFNFDPDEAISGGLSPFFERILRLAPKHLADPPAVDAFMSRVRDYERRQDQAPRGFLDWWDRKKSDWFVVGSGSPEAVNILTVHKSKGLQFPVVFLPFQESKRNDAPTGWLQLPGGEPVDSLLFKVTQEMEKLSPEAMEFKQREKAARTIDHYNLWYVALTRAQDALYLWLPKDVLLQTEKKKGGGDQLQERLVGFLDSCGKEIGMGKTASWGSPTSHEGKQHEDVLELRIPQHRGFHWSEPLPDHVKDTAEMEVGEGSTDPLKWGNRIHRYLSLMVTREEIQTLESHLNRDEIGGEEGRILLNTVKSVVLHPDLYPYFAGPGEVYNEVDILMPDGRQLRPDRLVIEGDKARLLDYKTGLPQDEHTAQMESYIRTVEDMGLSVDRALLVYIGKEIQTRRIR